MANKDYKRMIAFGDWLEIFLKPGTKPWEYKALANDAISLLGIDYELDENDLSMECIELIEKNKEKDIDFYLMGLKNHSHQEKRLKAIMNREDPLSLQRYLYYK